MNRIKRFFEMAVAAAKRKDRQFRRDYLIGAVGIRGDGTVVVSCNLPADSKAPGHHAEARLARKLDVGAEVFVVRIGRNGQFLDSKPCPWCEKKLLGRGVERCYYSEPGGFGVLELA
jgi:tRNA(Arg) A34 adenosine deaminase TadA